MRRLALRGVALSLLCHFGHAFYQPFYHLAPLYSGSPSPVKWKKHKRLKRQRPFPLSQETESEVGDTSEEPNSISITAILNAALLISGTTVGGGFLALPTVVAPSGFTPSATALVGVWAFFLVESFVVVECIQNTRDFSSRRKGNDGSETLPGIAAAAKSAFGTVGETIIVLLLVLLTEATLVSQISRAGALFSKYRWGCATVALSVASIVFGPRQGTKLSAYVNSALTIVFVIMAANLFSTGAPAADWSGLTATNSWASLPGAIPTFLQLLVYGEILPTVCQLLKYRVKPIRLAIILGSILPLGLEIGWAALGMGLVPPSSTMGDPVDLLLAAGPVQRPLLVLAVTAILTTIIGSYLALQSTFDDVFPADKAPRKAPFRRLTAATSIVIPALAIASISPDLFLRAIDFAGSYPVVLLWGVAPPTIVMMQRRNGNLNKEQQSIPQWALLMLTVLSLGLFSTSAIFDLMFLAGKFKSLLL